MEEVSVSPKTECDVIQAQKFYNPLTHYSNRNWRRESVLHLRKTFKELHSKPLPKPFKSRLEGPSVNWDVFKCLNLAATYADKHTKDCMIFSYEDRTPDNAGRRMFLVTHPQHMWLNYKNRSINHRCTYEVIRENCPSKLYFDLEFIKMQNLERNGNEMTKIFIKCVIAAMIEVYNISLQASHFLWLDASTEQKFSSHLIVQIPGYAFKNNIVAGVFVTFLLSQIISRTTSNTDSCHMWPSPEELKLLIITDADKKHLFCDAGVYTKNRNFRLYLSTKQGKKAPLVLSEYNEYIPKDIASLKDLDETIFYDSLITYFRKDIKSMKLLSEPLNNENKIKVTPSKDRIFTNPKDETTSFSDKGPSPFPEIDNFILTQIKDFEVTGFIRKWVYLQKEEILVYDIGNYRFCSNIDRHHKSNNIMLIVDMNQKLFYQKCHDPECRSQNYKSIPKQLPSSVASTYTFSDDFFDANCFTQLRKNSTEMDNLNNSEEETESNNDNILKIDDSFFEESCPFTQLTDTSKMENFLKEDINNKPESQKQNDLEENESALDDNYFDDICIDELELNNNAYMKEDLGMNNYSTVSFEESNKNRIFLEKKKSSPDYITAEDEIMMAETAALLECSFDNQDMFSDDIF